MSNNEVKYEIKDLFDVPEDEIIVHGCNSKGVWGSGIAAEFKKRYQESYKEYQTFCDHGPNKTGRAFISSPNNNEKHWVCGLITSNGYGSDVDDVETIKINTTLAVDNLCDALCKLHSLHQFPKIKVYSNQFNSGLFKVPWLETERVLNVVLKKYPRIEWTVCTP